MTDQHSLNMLDKYALLHVYRTLNIISSYVFLLLLTFIGNGRFRCGGHVISATKTFYNYLHI